MWLDELFDLFAALRSRAREFQHALQHNEALTRYALIDPVLEKLGWDIHDPGQVIAEFPTGSHNQRADYGLLADGDTGKPALFIEAKSLGTPLAQGLEQSITYCIGKGVQYFVVTDGLRWQIYETHRPVPTAEKLVASVDLSTGATHQDVMKMLWLWRGNFATPEKPTAPELPPRPEPKPFPAPKPNGDGGPTPPPPAGPDWIPLTELYERRESQTRLPPPTALRFADGTEKTVTHWADLLVASVEWAVETGRLTPAMCPVATSRGTYIVHTEPVLANGKPFYEPRQVGGVWVDRAWSAARSQRRAIVAILRAVGEDPGRVYARWTGRSG